MEQGNVTKRIKKRIDQLGLVMASMMAAEAEGAEVVVAEQKEVDQASEEAGRLGTFPRLAEKVPEEKAEKVKDSELDPTGDVTLLVCVGCGGVFYHGLSRMVTWCQRRDKTEVVLVDPDKIEKHNRTRQWGDWPGAEKVFHAKRVLGELGVAAMMVPAEIKGPKELGQAIEIFDLLKRGGLKRIVVISTPDNHKCRVDVHEGCKLLASETGLEVMEITAGNDLKGGYAYGCVHYVEKGNAQDRHPHLVPDSPDVLKCVGDWAKVHPDILKEAELEKWQLAHPESCQDLDGDEQTMTTNQLTALCVWDLAEMMVVDGKVGEVLWSNGGDGSGQRGFRIWARLQDRKGGK